MKNIIIKVEPGSIAKEAGIEAGDALLSINGQSIEDIIEYKYCLAEEKLEIEIEKTNGERWVIEIEKDYDEELGIEFDNPILSEAKSCRNKCLFCFIDQLPPGMRKSLYFKDDDSRLSFLQGNYITLTNMTDTDIDKIIRYRISPINISVHATDGELRKKILNHPGADNILKILTKLAQANINMNCQIVLCPGINDGKELDNTLYDLGKLSRSIGSVAVVPVGLTKHRQGLYPIEPFNSRTAEETIKQIEEWQKKFKKKIERNFVYLSDEFYLLSGEPFPNYKEYDEFLQLENGVGLVVKFQKEFYNYLNRLSIGLKSPRKVTVATGTLVFPVISSMCKDLMKKIKNLDIQVMEIKNEFFGNQVTVAGLLTGQDIIKSLAGKPLGEALIIPESVLKADETVFLDDLTVSNIEDKLNIQVLISKIHGKEFIKIILGLQSKKESLRCMK